MNVLMALGEFRFEINSFTYERLRRKTLARIHPQEVIGAVPPLHNAGPGNDALSITSTFFPYHWPGHTGLSQAKAMRSAVGRSLPLVAARFDLGEPLGRWALLSMEDDRSEIHPSGEGQKICLNIELLFDPPPGRPDVDSILTKLNLSG